MSSESIPLSNCDFSSLPSDEIHLAMNNYDFYMMKPTILDRSQGNSLPINRFNKVPIIRVYGCLPSGHQVLCHIHGIFPYFFLEYDGKDSDASSVMNQKCAQLHTILEKGARQYYSKDDKSGAIGNLNHIANVSIVKGVPFYGFHIGWKTFYKVCLLNPSQVSKIADLLRDGKLLSKKVNTYETNIPYLLQFSADFNLFGCEWINIEKCYFRKPVLNTVLDIDNLMMTEELKTFLKTFCNGEHSVLNKNEFQRVGNGLLEIDILPSFIRNIEALEFRDLHNEFGTTGEKMLFSNINYYVSSTKRMVSDLNSQRMLFSLDKYENPDYIERNKDNKEQWQSTKDYINFYNKAKENMKLYTRTPRFTSFVKNDPRFDSIPNTYTAIKELWPNTPKTLASQEIESPITTTILDTSFKDYNTVPDGMDSDEDSGSGQEDNVDVNKKGDTDNTYQTDSDEQNEIGSRPDGLSESQTRVSNWRNKNYESMDFALTQSIAKRRKVVLSNPLTTQNEEVRRNKSNEGILYGKNSFRFKAPLLLYSNIVEDLTNSGYPNIEYQDLYFGNPRDLDTKPYVYAGKRFDINSTHLIDRVPVLFNDTPVLLENINNKNYFETWKYNKRPPSYESMNENTPEGTDLQFQKSQIRNKSPANKFIYKFKSLSPNKEVKKNKKIQETLTHLTLEIHVNTREDLKPDPQKDAVCAIFWKLDDETYPFDFDTENEGIMVVCDSSKDDTFSRKLNDAAGQLPLMTYETEFDMLDALTDLVILFDPDILSGFEVNLFSWGYLIQRSKNIHKFNLAEELSRVSFSWKNEKFDKKSRQYTHASAASITGRYVLNIWRIIRSNVALTQYTAENLAFNILHERIPHFSYSDLTNMWTNSTDSSYLATVLRYWMTRVRVNIKLLQKQDFIDKTIEQAKLIGVDFHSIYFRGSQYKVESFLIRMCKSESYILLAPTKEDVQNQRALECVPLVMEPESAFYKSPMVILDFQSLYPSIIMGYNYCYSTMLGRVRELNEKQNVVGVASFPLQKGLLTLLGDQVNIAPNGMVYVKPSIRKSILSRMLKEILDIRAMVKKTITELGPGHETLKKSLGNKQLALKLLANVTYGYTSASFSGRMPCSDLADSVVQTGRETLERAVSMIESNDNWAAKVVYGDTDSLFIYLPGRSKDDAFKIGHEISIAVSKANPDPIFLKFEKVYFPSILVSKKRYVGYSFESVDQKEPILDSKGIETVRRDGHPAQQKMVEQSLRILFDTKDLSKVKAYVQEQFSKIYQGNVSIQDFCFAKEVKLGRYKSESTAPAGAVVAKRKMEKDRRAEPQYKERVPYLVVRSKLGVTLRDRSISPEEFMTDESLELDADYYITKTLIPPLSRLLNITGINISDWITNLKVTRKGLSDLKNKKMKMLGDSLLCCNCKQNHILLKESKLCQECLNNKKSTTVSLLLDKYNNEKRNFDLNLICRVCSYRYSHDAGLIGDDIASKCNSYDCPIYYSKMKNKKYLTSNDFANKKNALEYLDKW